MSTNQCPTGQLCFNREIFMLVAVFVLVLSIYGYSKSESLSQVLSIPSQNINEPLTINTNTPIKLADPSPVRNMQIEIGEVVQSPRQNYQQKQIHRAEARIYDPLIAPARVDPYQYGVPVNVPTRGVTSSYQQIGALYSESNSSKPQILPLFGKPIHPGASKWLYYTSTSDFQSVKIPIHRNGRKCQGDFGCEEIYEGDQVNVHPYRCKFKVSLYDLEKPRYLPYV